VGRPSHRSPGPHLPAGPDPGRPRSLPRGGPPRPDRGRCRRPAQCDRCDIACL